MQPCMRLDSFEDDCIRKNEYGRNHRQNIIIVVDKIGNFCPVKVKFA